MNVITQILKTGRKIIKSLVDYGDKDYLITGYRNNGYTWVPTMAFDGVTASTRDMDYSKNITLGYGYPNNYLQFKVKNSCKINVFYGSSYVSSSTYLYKNEYPNALGSALASIKGTGTTWKWYVIDYTLKPDTNYMLTGYNTVICQIKFT